MEPSERKPTIMMDVVSPETLPTCNHILVFFQELRHQLAVWTWSVGSTGLCFFPQIWKSISTSESQIDLGFPAGASTICMLSTFCWLYWSWHVLEVWEWWILGRTQTRL